MTPENKSNGFVPLNDVEMSEMAKAIGLKDPEDVFSEIPSDLKCSSNTLGYNGYSQNDLLNVAARLAGKTDLSRPCFIGAGFYDRFVPPVLQESILRRTDYYTAYTPYQSEASQGILQALFEFQQGICALTGMDVSNASLYDGATSVAEAVLCIYNSTKSRTGTVCVSTAVNPVYRDVLKTYLSDLPLKIVEIPYNTESGQTDPGILEPHLDNPEVFAVVIQSPNMFGVIEDMKTFGSQIKSKDKGFIYVFEPASLSVLTTPAEAHADIAVSEGQSLGLPMFYGGLALGLFATTDTFLRRVPGRIVGLSVDTRDQPAYCLTLQTREQHIRREKATSNICTNHSLCAIYAGAYLRLAGAEGLKDIVDTSSARMEQFLEGAGSKVRTHFSGTSLFEVVIDSEKPLDHLPVLPLNRFYPSLSNSYLVTFTEKRTESDVNWLISEINKL